MLKRKQVLSSAAVPMILLMSLGGCMGGKDDGAQYDGARDDGAQYDGAQVGRAMMLPQAGVAAVEPCAAGHWREQLLDRRDAVLAGLSLPAGHRVLHPGSLISADVVESRMTVTVNGKGRIDRVYCG